MIPEIGQQNKDRKFYWHINSSSGRRYEFHIIL